MMSTVFTYPHRTNPLPTLSSPLCPSPAASPLTILPPVPSGLRSPAIAILASTPSLRSLPWSTPRSRPRSPPRSPRSSPPPSLSSPPSLPRSPPRRIRTPPTHDVWWGAPAAAAVDGVTRWLAAEHDRAVAAAAAATAAAAAAAVTPAVPPPGRGTPSPPVLTDRRAGTRIGRHNSLPAPSGATGGGGRHHPGDRCAGGSPRQGSADDACGCHGQSDSSGRQMAVVTVTRRRRPRTTSRAATDLDLWTRPGLRIYGEDHEVGGSDLDGPLGSSFHTTFLCGVNAKTLFPLGHPHPRWLHRLLASSAWPVMSSTLSLRTFLPPAEVGSLLRTLLTTAYGSTVTVPARHSGSGGPAWRLAIVTGGGRPLVGTVDRRADARMEVRLRARHGKGGGDWEDWVEGVWARLQVDVRVAEARLRAALCG